MDSRKAWIVWVAAGILVAGVRCSSATRPPQTPAPRAAAEKGGVPSTRSAPAGPMALTRGAGHAALSSAPQTTHVPPSVPSIEVRHSLRNVTSRPLSVVGKPPQTPPGTELRDIEMEEGPTAHLPTPALKRDSVLQKSNPGLMPAPLVNFEGTANENSVQPADTTMAVGPNHIVQWVNLSLQIFDKSGVSLSGPVDGNTLFTDLGGDCAAINGGDIIVMYDQLADRWFLSQLAPAIFGATGNHECMAVSTSGDPLGSYYLYDYLYSDSALNDYPHFGTWPDAYYMTVREFGGLDSFTMTVTAFDRQAMLNGQPLTAIFVNLHNRTFDGLLPADLDGPNPPPGGPNLPPEVLMGVGTPDTDGSPSTVIHLYKMHPDFATPANSTFTGPTDLPIADFNYVPFFYGVTEPQGAAEALGWVLYRLPYRNYGTHESLVLHHDALDDVGRVSPRWYEIRDPYGTPTVEQQGTFAPADGVNRWMGAIAMDANNNIAMGYSVSNETIPPGIRYAGRLAADPPGELTQGETTLIPGQGSFLGHRWGDYSTIDIDPVDDCTFWYTTMYVGVPGISNWQTRVGSFKFPTCAAPTFGTVEGSVTDGTSGLAGAHVVVTGGGGGGGSDSDASGHYGFDAPAGTYSLTATKYGYFPTTVPNVVITGGGDTVQNFVLTVAPPVTITGTVRDSSGGNWPLYAKIVITTARGPILTVFTDPATGNYSIPLVTATTYNFQVSAVSPGYKLGSGIVTAQAGVVADFSLNVDLTVCTAPGYSGPPCVAGAGGLVVGSVLDANTGLGLNGAKVADLPQPGNPSTTTFATPEDPAQPDGFYILFAAAGSQSLQASLDRYTSQTKSATVAAHGTVRLDFSLAAGQLDVAPRPLSARVDPGEIVGMTLDLANAGGASAGFTLLELTVPPPAPDPARGFADPAKRQAALDRVPEGRFNARDTAGFAAMTGGPRNVAPLAGGNVLNTYPTHLAGGWGIAYDTDVNDFWISNSPALGGDSREYRSLPDGTFTGDSIDDASWIGDFAADGAFNARTGKLWRVNVGGDNCIYELDPIARVATGNNICGSPWTAFSQRGLAYDVTTDTYYVGGTNEGVLYHIDGTGAVLDSTSVSIPIAGLAYNSTTGHLFAMTNHGPPPNSIFDVFVFDARHGMSVVGAFNVTQNGQPPFDFTHNGGAGMEIDCAGHLWLVDQVGQLVWEVESGESHVCAFNEIPWLSENPAQGTVSQGSTLPVACTFDSTGLSSGLRQAQLKVVTDTPYAVTPVAVDFTVRFLDVSDGSIFQSYIYGAAGAGVMPGCDPAGFLFCPSALVSRADMAGFILRAVHGADFVPTPYAGAFGDVHAGDYNADYIQSFWDEGYTVGCGNGNFCPDAVHTRGQTAVFILKGTHGPGYVPPSCASTHVFDDVACPPTTEEPFGDWIGELFLEQITAGCGATTFCPDAGIPNEQMGTFLVKAFALRR